MLVSAIRAPQRFAELVFPPMEPRTAVAPPLLRAIAVSALKAFLCTGQFVCRPTKRRTRHSGQYFWQRNGMATVLGALLRQLAR